MRWNGKLCDCWSMINNGRQQGRNGAGGGEVIRYGIGETSLGRVLVAESGNGICAITLGDDADELVADLQRRFRGATLIEGGEGFRERLALVSEFVEAPWGEFPLPLDLRGTAFQRRVWEALREIPAGSTTCYSAIAEKLGVPSAVRAVGGAIGANPVAVVVPCHRVVRRDGSLCGYHWGTDRKRALLERERQTVLAEAS